MAFLLARWAAIAGLNRRRSSGAPRRSASVAQATTHRTIVCANEFRKGDVIGDNARIACTPGTDSARLDRSETMEDLRFLVNVPRCYRGTIDYHRTTWETLERANLHGIRMPECLAYSFQAQPLFSLEASLVVLLFLCMEIM